MSAEMSKEFVDRVLEKLEERKSCKKFGTIERQLDIPSKDISLTRARRDSYPDENGRRISRNCGEFCNGRLVSVNNSSSEPATYIRLEGVQSGKRWKSVKLHTTTSDLLTNIDPGDKGEFWVYLDGPVYDKSFYIRVFTHSKTECLVKKTEEDYAREEREAAEESARREKEAEEQAIYENCVVSKSEGDASAITEIRSMCRRISKNPSWMQKLRWGN